MHELSIAQAIIEQVEHIARENSARRVLAVTVSVGQLSGVEPEALKLAYPLAAEDTVAAAAPLHIESVPAQAICRSCNREFAPDFYLFVCDRCGSAEVELRGGRDLLIKSVELDVP